eukprot:3392821-Pyramimonas_sp.AAC.1
MATADSLGIFDPAVEEAVQASGGPAAAQPASQPQAASESSSSSSAPQPQAASSAGPARRPPTFQGPPDLPGNALRYNPIAF